MGMSLKSKLFYKFVRHAMKKYVGNEQEYIRKRCPGQSFERGGRRESNYQAPKGYVLIKTFHNGLNFEFLKLNNVEQIPMSERKVIYMLHGGAYHLSMTDLYNGVMEKYSNGKYNVFTVDYRTAPKDLFPSAVVDAVEGYKYLLEKGYSSENIIMVGDSAGAGLALAMSIMLREQGYKLPKTYALSSPWVALDEVYTDTQKAGDVLFGWGDVLTKCAEVYSGGENLSIPLISPLYDDFKGFEDAKVYISVAKGEMLENSGVLLAEKLRNAGAEVTLDKLDSGMHAVITMYALGTKEVKYAWKRLNCFITSVMENK